jgi:hypothetical protein
LQSDNNNDENNADRTGEIIFGFFFGRLLFERASGATQR